MKSAPAAPWDWWADQQRLVLATAFQVWRFETC